MNDPNQDEELEARVGNIRASINDQNEPCRNVRYRLATDEIFTTPKDASNDDHKVPSSYNIVTVAYMMEENAVSMRKVMYLKLLRIVAQCKKGENYAISTKKGSTSRAELGNHRLFLCMDVFSKNGQTVYMIHNSTSENKRLWSKAIALRDNGEFTIGTVFAVLAPKRITEKYNSDIPIVHSDGGIVVMKDTNELQRVLVHNNLSENVTRAFHVQGNLTVHNVSVVDTKCTGFFCDRQRIHELNRTMKGCGCYSTTTRLSNMVISFDLAVHANIEFDALQFTSHQFTNLFLNKPFPDGINWRVFDHNSNLDKLIDSILSIVDYVNDNGGWLITGWSKRGEINDISITNTGDTNKKVAASEIKHHITTIQIADEHMSKYIVIKQKQFDVSTTM